MINTTNGIHQENPLSNVWGAVSVIRSIIKTSNLLLLGEGYEPEVAAQLTLLAQEKLAFIEDACNAYHENKLSQGQNPDTYISALSYSVTNPSSRIREIRKARGITQKDIAELVGVTPSCVTQWESGLISPNCDKLIPLAKVLGCDPLWLIGK